MSARVAVNGLGRIGRAPVRLVPDEWGYANEMLPEALSLIGSGRR